MKKKICAIIGFIIILGTVLTLTIGLNVSLEYSSHTMIQAEVGQEFKIYDIKAITKEVFGKTKVEISKASEYEDSVCLKIDGIITDEQKDLLCQKINEKYNSDIKTENLEIKSVANTRLRDLAIPYILPVSISTVCIFVYLAIKFRKQQFINIILETGCLIILAEWLYLALLAITRYPIDKMVIPAGLIIYFAVILTLSFLYEKNGEKNKKVS